MAVSNSTTLNDLIGQIVSSDAVGYAYSNRVMRPLIRAYAVPPGAGSYTIPKFDSVSVSALVEGVAPASTTMTTSGVTLTPTERGTYVQISKRALHADPFVDLAPYGTELGRAMAQDEDALILDVMSAGFSTRINNDTTDVDVPDILTAISTLESLNAGGPFFAVFHPASWAKMRAKFADTGTYGVIGERTVEGFGQGFTNMAGYVGSPFGIPTFISTQVNTGGDGRRENVVFAQSAAAVGFIQDIGIDIDDNVTARALDLMAWYSLDAKLLQDAYGVIVEDAA
jgi:hypothetical protein